MRTILSISLILSAAAFASPALAAKCNIPPPPWWNAPKVTNIYEGGRSSSNIFASTHTSWRYNTTQTMSAQRRYSSQPVRYRDPGRRW